MPKEKAVHLEMVVRPFLLNHNTYLENKRSNSASLDSVIGAINGNIGNSLITYSLANFLNLKKIEGLANMFDEASIETLNYQKINQEFTHLIIIIQDNIQVNHGYIHWEKLSKIIEKIKIPIIVFSLGANTINQPASVVARSLPANLVNFLKVVDHHAAGVGVRGAFTAEVLTALGNSNFVVSGCPAWFAAGPERKVPYPKLDRSKPVAGLGLFAHSEVAETHYFLQSELLQLRALYAGQPPNASDAEILAFPYTGFAASSLEAFFNDHVYFFVSPAAWIKALRAGYSCAIGARVHGAFAAMSAGVPALCTAGDMRGREMCELFGVPLYAGLCAGDIPFEELYDLCNPELANSAYPRHYEFFTSWLAQLGLPNEWRVRPSLWRLAQLAPLPRFERLRRFTAAIRPDAH